MSETTSPSLGVPLQVKAGADPAAAALQLSSQPRKEGLRRSMRPAAVFASEGGGFRGSRIQKADDQQDTAPGCLEFEATTRRIKQHL